MIRKWTLLLALGGLALAQISGCYIEYDDHDVDMWIVNNHHDDVAVQVEDDFWGWLHVEYLDRGESERVWFDDDHEGEDLRARDGGDTVGRSVVRDGATWTIGGNP